MEGGTEESAIQAKISDNRSKMIAEMILAKDEQEVERLFNLMNKTDKELGYDRLYKYKNEKFLQAKARLGIEYAWPANR